MLLKKFFTINNLNTKKTRQYLVFAILALFSWWLMFFTFSYQDHQFVIRSRLWSDFAAHIPLIRSFSLGNNFPPEYPQFANEPIRYHFLFYLLVGMLEKIGLNLAVSLNLLSAMGLFVLLVMIYLISQLLADSKKIKPQSTIVIGLLAVILFLFNSSLTFVDYFQKNGFSFASIINIIHLDQFVNFGPWNGDSISAFWNWNIYTNQRHLAFSIGVGLLIIWPLVKAVFDQTYAKTINKLFWLLICVGLMALPFFNLAVYMMAIIFILLWLGLNPSLLKKFSLGYGLAILCSLPSFYYYWALGGNILHWQVGFLAQEKTWLGVIYYWWRNLGLYVVLWPVIFLKSNWNQKKWLLIFSFYFVLANLFQLSTDMINNHKLINFFQIGFSMLLAAKLGEVWTQSIFKKILVLLLLVPLTLSGVMDALAIMRDRPLTLTDAIYQPMGSWIVQETDPQSVFITTAYLYNPVSFTGRKTYLDYGYFDWSMGYQTQGRRDNLKTIFALEQNQSDWCDLLTQEKIDYILISPGKGDLEFDAHHSWLVRTWRPVYQSMDGYLIFSINQICSPELQPL